MYKLHCGLWCTVFVLAYKFFQKWNMAVEASLNTWTKLWPKQRDIFMKRTQWATQQKGQPEQYVKQNSCTAAFQFYFADHQHQSYSQFSQDQIAIFSSVLSVHDGISAVSPSIPVSISHVFTKQQLVRQPSDRTRHKEGQYPYTSWWSALAQIWTFRVRILGTEYRAPSPVQKQRRESERRLGKEKIENNVEEHHYLSMKTHKCMALTESTHPVKKNPTFPVTTSKITDRSSRTRGWKMRHCRFPTKALFPSTLKFQSIISFWCRHQKTSTSEKLIISEVVLWFTTSNFQSTCYDQRHMHVSQRIDTLGTVRLTWNAQAFAQDGSKSKHVQSIHETHK